MPQRDGARQGVVPWPSGGRRRRHHPADRRGGLQADQGRLRGPALGDRRRGGDEARRHPAARPRQVRGQTLKHRGHARAQEGGRRGGLQGSRRDRRTQLQDRGCAPGLHRTACLSGKRHRRQGHDLEFQPRPVHGPGNVGPADRRPAKRHPRYSGRDRRWLRRQDHHLPRASGTGSRKKVGPAREDGDEPRGGDARLGSDLGVDQQGQDWRQEGRHDRGRSGHLLAAGRRLPRLADPRRRRLRLRSVRYSECPHAGLRRRLQPLQGRGLPRARRADRRLCGRVRAG